MKITKSRLLTALLSLGLLASGCESGGDDTVVLTGNGNNNGNIVQGANNVALRVSVPPNVPGAAAAVAQADGHFVAFLKVFSSPAQAQDTEDFTLPGGTCTVFDDAGLEVETEVVEPDGTVEFEDLPTGDYRFVVTTEDPSVVLQTVGSSSPEGQTVLEMDLGTTAATLIMLAANEGEIDIQDFQEAEIQDTTELELEIEDNLVNDDDWITEDGETVNDDTTEIQIEDHAGEIEPDEGEGVGPDGEDV